MIKKILSSGKLTGILLMVTAITLAAATFIENIYSTETARKYIYYSPVFFTLLTLLAINFLLISNRYIKARRIGMVVLHLSFIVIMIGAFTTHTFGKEGILHLREGVSSSALENQEGIKVSELPFEVTLERFHMEKYSDLGSPSSYESYIKISGKTYHVYMNSFVKYKGYRLYQSSYDRDMKGSILSVSYDPWGITITYLGYIFMLIGFIWSMSENGSRFRILLGRIGCLIMILSCSSYYEACAQEIDMETVKQEAQLYSIKYAPLDSIAEKFGRLTIQTTEGRLEPVDTYSGEILQKVSKQRTLNGLSANQVLLGICTQQQIWSYVPFIRISNDTINTLLSLPVGTVFASYSDAFDQNGQYILTNLVDGIYSKSPKDRNATDKDILKFDERLNIVSSLMSGRLLAIFPKDKSKGWYSPGDQLDGFEHMDSVFVSHALVYVASRLNGDDADPSKAAEIVDMIKLYQQKKGILNNISERKIKAEIIYNRLNAVKISGFGFMTFGLILVILTVIALVKGKNYNTLGTIISGAVILLFSFLTVSLALRWYISGNAPWSNAYESVVYVGWATALIGICMQKKSRMIYSLASFFAGAILFVSNLSFMDPQITPLVPVLKSYWLVIHVATITASYGFFGVSFLIGLTTAIIIAIKPKGLDDEISKLTASNELLLWIGLALMTIGTFLGAVWANQSWGRYWGWDPKETWALITVIIYSIVLHTRHIFSKRTDLVFAILSIYSLGTVLMTFFGVNYYLSGLHSYAGGSSPVGLKVIWIAYGIISAICITAIIRRK